MDKIPNSEIQFMAVNKTKKFLFSLLIALFFVGVAYGAIIAGNSTAQTSDSLNKIMMGFVEHKASAGFLQTALFSISSGSLFVLLLFLSGFSAVGQPASFFLVLFRGIGLGTSMGYFYMNMGLKGILMSLALIVPTSLISGYAILLGGRESVKLSNRFFQVMTTDDLPMAGGILRTYSIKFLILWAMILISAGIDGVCTLFFAPLFR